MKIIVYDRKIKRLQSRNAWEREEWRRKKRNHKLWDRVAKVYPKLKGRDDLRISYTCGQSIIESI